MSETAPRRAAAAYDPASLEAKWQSHWEKTAAFAAPAVPRQGKKQYVLDMFPYPSGAGLHVGHPKGYIATDAYCRYLRAKGYDVLHPMGWDAFGLPAENYAIKTGVHPADSTAENAANFRRQLKAIGLGYDWTREFATSDPSYYRWTQWLFGVLYEKGLAYRKAAKVNWCPGCQTVLANEQVVNGLCDRSKDPVEQRDLEQWFFKVTAYAEELLSALDGLDWPESIKQAQRNWIGKSEGAELEFAVKGSDQKIKVFTTRADTLMGVTYLVVAPEHPALASLVTDAQREAVAAYQERTKLRTELDRQEDQKQKTGVPTGAIALHPITGEELPIWTSDYVLATYATGAVMAVPAHDVRDEEFARAFDLPSKEVVVDGKLANSGQFDGMDSGPARAALAAAAGGRMVTTYRLRDWLVSRQRYWGAPIPVVYDETNAAHLVPVAELPVLLPDDVDFRPTGESPLKRSVKFHDIPGKPGWRRESDTMDTFVCSSWYYLRFCDSHNADAAFDPARVAEWMPVDTYVGGAEHAVLHLLFARFVTKALRDAGYVAFGEPFKTLRNQGLIIAEDGRKMSKSYGNVVNPDDVIREYGADTFRLYECFMGPFEDSTPWSTKGIIGTRRFLDKAWRFVSEMPEGDDSAASIRAVNVLADKVGRDIASFQFNTAVSAMMIFINETSSWTVASNGLKRSFVQMLAPFAPHAAEELWQALGGEGSVMNAAWPEADAALLVADTVTMAVQVKGKTRGTITVAAGASQDEALAAARADEGIAKHLPESAAKVIYVPGKILNVL